MNCINIEISKKGLLDEIKSNLNPYSYIECGICGGVKVDAKELAKALGELGFRIVSGGTDTHLMLVDLSEKGVTGSDASLVLEMAGITVNKKPDTF
jgi:hypothetical protein